MRFEKERVDSDGRGRARERRDKFPFSSGPAVRGARLLDAVRRVEEDRNAKIAHNDERPKIVDQSAVPKEGSPFPEYYLPASERGEFRDDKRHIAGRHELPFFNVDRLARLGGACEQIGLAREKRGNLQ